VSGDEVSVCISDGRWEHTSGGSDAMILHSTRPHDQISSAFRAAEERRLPASPQPPGLTSG
jgi:hypothetical protein